MATMQAKAINLSSHLTIDVDITKTKTMDSFSESIESSPTNSKISDDSDLNQQQPRYSLKYQPSRSETELVCRSQIYSPRKIQFNLNELATNLKFEQLKSDSLTKELNSARTALTAEKKLSEKLSLENFKLVEEVKHFRKLFEGLQVERNKLYNHLVALKNEGSQMRGAIATFEDQVIIMESTNRKLIDDLNFQREMLADYKAENAMLIGQFKNLQTALTTLKSEIEEGKQKLASEVYDILGGKTESLKTSLNGLKNEVNMMGNEQKELVNKTNGLFSSVRKMEENFEKTKTELNRIKYCNNSEKEAVANSFLAREVDLKRTIEAQQSTIRTMTIQITELKYEIVRLEDSLNSYVNSQFLKPHTNSDYVNKVIKQNHREVAHMKEIMEAKDSEVERIKQKLQDQNRSSLSKDEEISKLRTMLRLQTNNKIGEFNGEIEELKSEKKALSRKVEQLNEKMSGMKTEIMEKDRIIMNYVALQKNKAF